jgi:uncharacterized protein (DUF488 family)
VTIYTIGHSTRPFDEFRTLLDAHTIKQVADIRTIPKSRRHPQFGGAALAQSLADAGLAYRHFPGLGGLRKPRRDSRNGAWRNESFRGYADHMETDEFQRSLDALIAWSVRPTAIMCAEAVWWRCHRQLVADALVARGIEVRHIAGVTSAPLHALTEFARTDANGRVTYPGVV